MAFRYWTPLHKNIKNSSHTLGFAACTCVSKTLLLLCDTKRFNS